MLACADALLAHPFPARASKVLADEIRSLYDLDAVGVVWLDHLSGGRLYTSISDHADAKHWLSMFTAMAAKAKEAGCCSIENGASLRALPDDTAPLAALLSSEPIVITKPTRDQIGQWIRARLQMEEQATRDPLTGLLNRALAKERASALLSAAQRHRRPLVALMMDLDRFKVINDRYGHPVGDMYLQAVADALRRHVRGADEIFRMGGDEFLILLPETSLQDGHHVAKRLRNVIHDLRLPGELSEVRSSLSVGVAGSDGFDTWEALYGKADQALGLAKRSSA